MTKDEYHQNLQKLEKGTLILLLLETWDDLEKMIENFQNFENL